MKFTGILAIGFVSLMALVLPGGHTFAARSAMVRFVHAAPDSGALNLYVNGKLLDSDVAAFSGNKYQAIAAGVVKLQISPAGGDAEAAASVPARLEPGGLYTIAAVGAGAAPTPVVLSDSGKLPAADKAIVRLYHLAYDAPAIALREDQRAALITGVAFPASAAGEFEAGSHTFLITPTTLDQPTLDKQEPRQLTAGVVYDLFVMGDLVALKVVLQPADLPITPSPAILPATGSNADRSFTVALLIAVMVIAGFWLRRLAART